MWEALETEGKGSREAEEETRSKAIQESAAAESRTTEGAATEGSEGQEATAGR